MLAVLRRKEWERIVKDVISASIAFAKIPGRVHREESPHTTVET